MCLGHPRRNSLFLIIPDGALNRGVSIAVISLIMLGVVGPVEETCKFLTVRLRAYRSPYFEEPMDGLVHAAAASLGFASLENLFYILDYGPEVMIIRAPLSTLGHLIFGSLWGYALGLRHEGGDARLVWRGLGLAALLHGLFNVAVSLPTWSPVGSNNRSCRGDPRLPRIQAHSARVAVPLSPQRAAGRLPQL